MTDRVLGALDLTTVPDDELRAMADGTHPMYRQERQKVAYFQRRWARGIAGLLSTRTVRDAARASGIPERTLNRWLTVPAFRAAYRAASQARLAEAVAQLRGASGEAVAVLREALTHEHAGIRLRAAALLLDVAVRTEVDDLAVRVDRLEAAQRPAGSV